ncbi:MAG: hypothetical protein IK115_14175 [Lachnospiraceae bacterium]|nr:hypothetical protein [Lachnospiraceae bacterium]
MVKKRILCCLICMSILFGMHPPMCARAEDDPVQTLGTVSAPLYHVHGDRYTGCYSPVYKKCGGSFTSPSTDVWVCNRCGKRILGTVGPVHDGDYVDQLTCTEHYLGSFYIERALYGREVDLIAGISSKSEAITEYEISWDAEGAYESDGKSVLPVRERGTFHATLRYYDSKLKSWKEESLSYTELSLPATVRYYSEGALLKSSELEAGESLSAVEVPQRRGYVFKGYYAGEEQYHDEEGRPVGKGTRPLSRAVLDLQASWEALRFSFYYGSDGDGDGLPDSVSELVYNEAPPALGLTVPGERPGFLFEGYYIGDKKLYDENAAAVGIWTELPEGETLILREKWSVRKYRITAGAGNVIEIEYGDELPPLSPPAEREGKAFDGYFYGERLIYDSEGQPRGELPELFELGEVELDGRWHDKIWKIRYGEDADGDGLPDEVMELRYGDEIPDIRPGEPEGRKGYEFDGYEVDGVDAYDRDGKPAGKWKPSLEEGDYTLEPKWAARSYTVYYGPDGDGDGVPDEQLTVVYGESYPAVSVPELGKNTAFDGYYLEDECVFDAYGRPTGLWRWDTERPMLTLRSHELKNREDEDKEKERREKERREQEEKERQEQEEKERKEQEEKERQEQEEKERKEQEEKERKEQEEKERQEQEEKERQEQEEKERKEKEKKEREERERKRKEREKKENGGNGESGDPAPGEQGRTPGADDEDGDKVTTPPEEEGKNDDSVSDNTVSDNSVSGNGIVIREKRPLAGSAGTLRAGNTGNTAAAGTEREEEDEELLPQQRTVIPDSEEDEDEESGPEEAEPVITVAEGPQEESGTAPVKEESPGEGGKKSREESGNMPVIRRVATVGAVTVGGLGGIVGAYAGLVYLFAMAEVDTVCPDGRKKRLGRLSIRSEKGKAFLVRISRELLEQCETDTLCLRIPALFVLRYHDRTIVVQSRGKKQEKKISREISIKI